MNRLTFLSVEFDDWSAETAKQAVELVSRALNGAIVVSGNLDAKAAAEIIAAGPDGCGRVQPLDSQVKQEFIGRWSDEVKPKAPPPTPPVKPDPAAGRRGRPRTSARNWQAEDVPRGLARQRETVKLDCPPAWRDPERTNKDRCLAALEKGTWLSTREISDKTGLEFKQVQNVFNVTAKPGEYARRMSDSGVQFAPVGTSPGF